MSRLHYRMATERDLALLAQLNQQLILDGADSGDADLVHLKFRMRGWLKSKRYRAVLFGDHGLSTVVAYALFREHRAEVYLRQFFVASAMRRQGVGRTALRLLRERIWSAGKRLVVEALTTNPDGLAFWRSVGFCDYAVTLEIPAVRQNIQPPRASRVRHPTTNHHAYPSAQKHKRGQAAAVGVNGR